MNYTGTSKRASCHVLLKHEDFSAIIMCFILRRSLTRPCMYNKKDFSYTAITLTTGGNS